MGTVKKAGWGKPDVYVKNLKTADGAWAQVPTPMENTTVLTVTKGEKKEAKIEGGTNEDVLYGANSYSLAHQHRLTSGKEMPIKHVNGIVDDDYAVVVVPKNAKAGAPGLYIPESAVSVEDGFTTADGGTFLYTHDAKGGDDEGGSQLVKWGEITVTKDESGKITIKAKGGDFGEAEETL